MKIAVVGCGAVGSYYGAMLARAGQEVHFLLRSDSDIVRRKGVFIRSPAGDFNARPRCATASEGIGVVDVVLIALKATANDQFRRLLPPLVGSNTAVVTLQNGLGNEEALAEIFPIPQIVGGLCFICVHRLAPGLIHHQSHGAVALGEFQRRPEPRTHDLASAFRHAGVPCKVVENLDCAHWEKLVWNIPFNGLGVASAAGYDALLHPSASPSFSGLQPCLTTDRLLSDARWESLVRELMAEVIAAARALGHAIPPGLAEKQILSTRTMGDYKPSTVLDFELNRPLELEPLFLEPLRRALRAGVAATRLQALCDVLVRLQRLPQER